MSNERFALTDHLCRKCGTGRILQRIGGGPSGGGNPSYRCATCEAGSSGMGPSCLCWCGHVLDIFGLPFETMCHRGPLSHEQAEIGWKVKAQHYGLSVCWMYAPEQSTAEPDFQKAAKIVDRIARMERVGL